MKVSVIIPAYNEEKYLPQCLISLTDQTDPADEIIVVDNNSTDRTSEIAGSVKSVRLLRESVQGRIPARNLGFDSAKGDLLLRCDADCILPRTWIADIKNQFLLHKDIDGLVGSAVFYDFPLKNINPVISNSIELIKKNIGNYPFFGSNMAITRKAWLKIRSLVCDNDRHIHEDLDLSIHLIKTGGRIVFDKNIVVKISARRFKRKPLDILAVYPYKIIRTIQSHRGRFTFSGL